MTARLVQVHGSPTALHHLVVQVLQVHWYFFHFDRLSKAVGAFSQVRLDAGRRVVNLFVSSARVHNFVKVLQR